MSTMLSPQRLPAPCAHVHLGGKSRVREIEVIAFDWNEDFLGVGCRRIVLAECQAESPRWLPRLSAGCRGVLAFKHGNRPRLVCERPELHGLVCVVAGQQGLSEHAVCRGV